MSSSEMDQILHFQSLLSLLKGNNTFPFEFGIAMY
jgi:hypothetical protein